MGNVLADYEDGGGVVIVGSILLGPERMAPAGKVDDRRV